MTELPPNKRAKEGTGAMKSPGRWVIAFLSVWSVLLLLVLPFSMFPLVIRLGVTLVSLCAVYALMRVARGWHYLWAIPLVLFWLAANYNIWSCPNWSEADKVRAFEEWRDREAVPSFKQRVETAGSK